MEAILLEEVECVAGAVGTRVVQEAKDGVAFLKTGAVVVLFLVAEEGARTREAADNLRPHSPWVMATLSTLLEATPRSQYPSGPEALSRFTKPRLWNPKPNLDVTYVNLPLRTSC